MPRQTPVPLSDTLVTIKKGEAAPAPEPDRRREAPPLKRVSMTFRITESAYERLRRQAFETRVSQQALVDQALEQFLAQRDPRGGGPPPRAPRHPQWPDKNPSARIATWPRGDMRSCKHTSTVRYNYPGGGPR
jgi:hypothetical protein